MQNGSGEDRERQTGKSIGSVPTRAWEACAEVTLIEKARAGETQPFAILYRRYRSRVFGFIVKRVGSSAEADDLTQETFVIAHGALASFEGRSSFSSWLLGIAHNVCRRAARQASRWMMGANHEEHVEELPDRGNGRIEGLVEARRMLARCDVILQSTLSRPQQEIFRLRYAENQSIRAIACEMGKTNEAVKASLRRTRSALLRGVPELERGRPHAA